MEKSPKSDHLLWYEQAASEWEEALPLGNGRLGVMVFGNPTKEHIQLNDDSLWPKDLEWGNPEGTFEDLKQIRNLLIDGDIEKTDHLLIEKSLYELKGMIQQINTIINEVENIVRRSDVIKKSTFSQRSISF